MNNIQDEITLMGYLEDALSSEHGVRLVLESHDEMKRMRQRLYKTRAENEQYRSLVLSEHDNELWIVRKADQ